MKPKVRKPILQIKEIVQVSQTPYSLFMRIQGLPKTYNSMGRSHWAVKLKESRYWIDAVGYRVKGRLPPIPLLRAQIKLIRCSSNPPDADGLVSSFKAVVDGLTRAGVLADDKMSNIGFPNFEWRKGKPKCGYIEVIVNEIVEAAKH